MNDLVGIIRTAEEIQQALDKIDEFKVRYSNIEADGKRPSSTPGWHLAIDMRNMLLVSECVAKAALARTESRGGHTRDDHPAMDAEWRRTLLVCRAENDDVMPDVSVTRELQPPMRGTCWSSSRSRNSGSTSPTRSSRSIRDGGPE